MSWPLASNCPPGGSVHVWRVWRLWAPFVDPVFLVRFPLHRQMSRGTVRGRGLSRERAASHSKRRDTTWRSRRGGWSARIQRVKSAGDSLNVPHWRTRISSVCQGEPRKLWGFWDLSLTCNLGGKSQRSITPLQIGRLHGIIPASQAPHPAHTRFLGCVERGAGEQTVEKEENNCTFLKYKSYTFWEESRGEWLFGLLALIMEKSSSGSFHILL